MVNRWKVWLLKTFHREKYDLMLDSILSANPPASRQEIDLMIKMGLPLGDVRNVLNSLSESGFISKVNY